MRFTILYEDQALIAVDKAAGVLTVPTPRREKNTLVDLVSAHVRRRVVVVHRLDRDTSGVLLFAKDDATARAVMDQWHRHKAERHYDALVHGVPASAQGEVRQRLVTDARSLDRRVARDGAGELAVTRFRVVERVRDAALLDVTLETGRRNQIRVALASLGRPVLGDVRYARRERPHPQWPRGLLGLHARSLTVTHPRTGAALVLEAPTPAAFVRFLDAARARR
ncbi:MAG: RluA family pseudouridine synthase [Deltaproteobacteria bacterium]|nr:RluA family pseudouridine synthase [Deltaproteobacteria bacterium]